MSNDPAALTNES